MASEDCARRPDWFDPEDEAEMEHQRLKDVVIEAAKAWRVADNISTTKNGEEYYAERNELHLALLLLSEFEREAARE